MNETTLKVPKVLQIVTNSVRLASVTPTLNAMEMTSPVSHKHVELLPANITKFIINTSADTPHLPESSSNDDEIRQIIFIVMIIIALVLLSISITLCFCIRKYRAKNRRSIRV